MSNKKYFLFIFSIVLITFLIVLVFSNIKVKEYKKVFNYFDSYEEIRIYTYSYKKAINAFNYIENILKDYDLLVSRSEIDGNNTYAINRSNETLEINSKLYNLIEYGIYLNKQSNGYININSGEFTNTYNKAKLVLNKPNYKDVILSEINLIGNNKIDSKEVNLDFSSIIKLYVGDIIKKYLEENKIRCYTINFLGSAIVGENKNSSFLVAIEKPFTNASEYISVLALNNMSVSTVGAYQNYYKVDDRIYHNLINYNTKEMVRSFDSVTVVAGDPSIANMLSYVLYFVSLEEGMELLKKYDAHALWYTLDGKTIYSENMKNYVSQT